MSRCSTTSGGCDRAAGQGERRRQRPRTGFLNPQWGALLVALALPGFVPVPLPFGFIPGTAIILLAAQLLAGREQPWLPAFVDRHGMSRATVTRALRRLLRVLRRIGLRPRRRPPAMEGWGARRLIALALIANGLAMAVPLPFATQLPSLAVSAFGLGLMRRDGVVVLAGHVLTAVATAWTTAMVWGGLALWRWLFG